MQNSQNQNRSTPLNCAYARVTFPNWPPVPIEDNPLKHTYTNRDRSGSPNLRESVLFLAASILLSAAVPQAPALVHSDPPLAFEENHGQAPAGVNYLSRVRCGTVLFRAASIA